MDIQRHYYNFYRPYLSKICQTILDGKCLILVGVDSIGKTLLVERILSAKFKKEYLKRTKVKLVFLSFKDKLYPTLEQLYRYWLMQTAATLGYKLNKKETFNDFSFYHHMNQMVKFLKKDGKLSFILLDFQYLLNQGESFFKNLIYLHWYAYGKISYVILSEPHILESQNIWVQTFIERFTNYKFTFLETLDKITTLADIKREEKLINADLRKHYSLITKYSAGLHGFIGGFCLVLKNNPKIRNIRQLVKMIGSDKMWHFWIKKLLDGLPITSLHILKKIVNDKKIDDKDTKNIFFEWLIELKFLKNNGTFRYKAMLPLFRQSFASMKKGKDMRLMFTNNQFQANGERIRLTKKESLLLKTLFDKKDKLVTFDKLGKILWKGQEEKFSLWAISQIVRRLRKKLSNHFLNPKTLRSVRGEGYILD